MVRIRLEGCSFMEGVWVDKPLLSAETVTGGVYMAQCCISSGRCSGSSNSESLRVLQPQATDMRGKWGFM